MNVMLNLEAIVENDMEARRLHRKWVDQGHKQPGSPSNSSGRDIAEDSPLFPELLDSQHSQGDKQAVFGTSITSLVIYGVIVEYYATPLKFPLLYLTPILLDE